VVTTLLASSAYAATSYFNPVVAIGFNPSPTGSAFCNGAGCVPPNTMPSGSHDIDNPRIIPAGSVLDFQIIYADPDGHKACNVNDLPNDVTPDDCVAFTWLNIDANFYPWTCAPHNVPCSTDTNFNWLEPHNNAGVTPSEYGDCYTTARTVGNSPDCLNEGFAVTWRDSGQNSSKSYGLRLHVG
jgi:hypothetical protein